MALRYSTGRWLHDAMRSAILSYVDRCDGECDGVCDGGGDDDDDNDGDDDEDDQDDCDDRIQVDCDKINGANRSITISKSKGCGGYGNRHHDNIVMATST